MRPGANLELSPHAQAQLADRQIPEAWVWETVALPDTQEVWPGDQREHYFRYLAAAGGKCLHVVVDGARIVTVFFDRRRGRR
jgi:hypothetical protein